MGKPHLTLSLAVRGLDLGYTVAFENLDNLLTILKPLEIFIASKRWMKFLQKAALVAVDEVGFMPLTPTEENLFFGFVSSMAEKKPLIITMGASCMTYQEISVTIWEGAAPWM